MIVIRPPIIRCILGIYAYTVIEFKTYKFLTARIKTHRWPFVAAGTARIKTRAGPIPKNQ